MFDDEPEGQPDTIIKPPEAEEMVVKALQVSKRSKPSMFPDNLKKAAQYWISKQEPPNERTERVTPIKHNYEIVGWNTPYHDRLVQRLHSFLSLWRIHQVFIIDMVSQGVFWRGDTIDFFKTLIELNEEKKETFALGEKDEYIDQVFKKINLLKFQNLPYDKDALVMDES